MRRLALLLAAVCFPVPAFAHHAMGGEIPQSFVQGFVSGLAHPILGPDHFLFLIVAGLLVCSMDDRVRRAAPLLVVAGGIFGTASHLAMIELSAVDAAVALSLALGGVLVLFRHRLSPAVMGLFLAVAGIFHGYAFGESIVGAQTGSLTGYLAGLAVIQVVVIAGSAQCFLSMRRVFEQARIARFERLTAGLAALSGVVFLALSLV